MRLPKIWIGVDVLGTQLKGTIVMNSAGGQRMPGRFRKEGKNLGFDRDGEALWTELVTRELEANHGREDKTLSTGGVEFHTHWIIAPDQTPVGLVVWLAEGPVAPRPVYNSWILDLERVTTRSGGDDLASIGDGRQVGEERPIRDLLRWTNPSDAPRFLALYYDALTGDESTVAEARWSVRPNDIGPWTHFWSAARVRFPDDSGRTVYGLTMKLSDRTDLDRSLGTYRRITGATMLIIDAERRVPISNTGPLAPLTEEQIRYVLEQVDLALILDAADEEQVIWLGDTKYLVSGFPLPTVQRRPVTPAAIILVPAQQTAA
jgi:hypothetical protein